ncbi:MAG: hypothetical protein ACXVC1_04945, partial [Tumebacillaceae bacterium]
MAIFLKQAKSTKRVPRKSKSKRVKVRAVVKKSEPLKKSVSVQVKAKQVKSTPVKSVKYVAGKKSFVLDDGLRKLIRKEAAELKMSEEEFLRLLVHFSEVMRTSIVPAGLLDGGGILQMLMSNPMALGMLKNVIGNMWSKFGSNNKSATGNAAPGHVMPGGRPGGSMGMGGMGGMGGMSNPMIQQ